MKKQLNIHLISDSTGETLNFITKAVLSQFPEVEIKQYNWFLTREVGGLEKIFKSLEAHPGVVIYTILYENIEEEIKLYCKSLGLPCISALGGIVKEFASYLGIPETKGVIGRQHQITDEYYNKMEAINYTLVHDDGNLAESLHDADIIILGVSRSSKSPTSIYLAYKGYKVGNIPFVRAEAMPKYLETLQKPLIVGFTIDPERLRSIRKTRLKVLDVEEETEYIDIEEIKREVVEAKKYFAKLNIPVINVTEKSIEETAVYIMSLLSEHQEKLGDF